MPWREQDVLANSDNKGKPAVNSMGEIVTMTPTHHLGDGKRQRRTIGSMWGRRWLL